MSPAAEHLALLPTINWADAFAKYCGGLPLEDIAHMMQYPLEKLENKARREQWPTMKGRVEAQMTGLVPVHPDELARRAELVQQNREVNHRGWVELRDEALDFIQTWKKTKGKGMIRKQWHNKGQIVEKDCDLTPAEMATFANYFQVICQGTYAALGDRVCSTGAKDDATSSPGSSGTPAITIILPGVISKPRSERRVEEAAQGPVIDLRDDLEVVAPIS